MNKILLLILLQLCLRTTESKAQLYDQNNDQVAGVNTLMTATTNNDVRGVSFFSKQGGMKLVNQKNFGGATALHLACREKNLEIAKILIANGADINAADKEGWTPLMRASLASSAAIVELLLSKNVQASDVNSNGESAIIHATLSGCGNCLDLMFERSVFLKRMDLQLLKEQLADALVIAKNNNNRKIRDLIESQLDKASKATPLIAKPKEEKAPPLILSDQVFEITSNKKEAAQPVLVAAAIPVATNKKIILPKNEITKTPTPAPTNTPPATEYKFTSGAQKKELKDEIKNPEPAEKKPEIKAAKQPEIKSAKKIILVPEIAEEKKEIKPKAEATKTEEKKTFLTKKPFSMPKLDEAETDPDLIN